MSTPPSPRNPEAPTGLYIHVPFCVRRCLYCDFYVLPLGKGPPAERMRQFRHIRHRRFLDALEAELASLPARFAPRTVYIGGGTPTEMPPKDLSRLFDALEQQIDLSHLTELSCEANPGTLDREMAGLLLERGVNRISVGVQSFLDPVLESLGRIHNRRDAIDAFTLLRDAGARNLSADLLFGLPGADLSDIDANLEVLAELRPEHVSWYSLEFEPGTAFTDLRNRGMLKEPDEEQVAEEYNRIRRGLRQLGYTQYELFSFTRDGFACEHNMNYWRGGGYYGCGPSAHSHVRGKRYANLPDLAAYIRAQNNEEVSSRTSEEILPAEAKAREGLMTWLRLTEGVEESAFKKRFGFGFIELLGESLEAWKAAGWVENKSGNLCLTPAAYLISDSLFREFATH